MRIAAKWLILPAALLCAIGAIAWTIFFGPYTEPLPKNLPPLTDPAAFPRRKVIAAKDGLAEDSEVAIELTHIIDWNAGTGRDGQGRALAKGEVKRMLVLCGFTKPTGTSFIFKLRRGNPSWNFEWEVTSLGPHGRPPRQDFIFVNGLAVYTVASSIAQPRGLVRIGLTEVAPVAYVACQPRGVSNGFRWSMRGAASRWTVQRTGHFTATVQIDAPPQADHCVTVFSSQDGNSAPVSHFGGHTGVPFHDSVPGGIYGTLHAVQTKELEFHFKAPSMY